MAADCSEGHLKTAKMNASGTVIFDFIYFSFVFRCYRSPAIEPLLKRGVPTLRTNDLGCLRRRRCQRRAAVGGRDAAYGRLCRRYRLRRVGQTKDGKMCLIMKREQPRRYKSTPDDGHILTWLIGPQSFCLADLSFRETSGRLPSDAAQCRQAGLALGSGRSAVG